MMFNQWVEACCMCLMLQAALMLPTCACAHTHVCTVCVYTPVIFQQSPGEHVPAVGHCFYAQASESTCAINKESVHLAVAWWL